MMKSNWVYRRGDIYCADLNPVIGSEQGGTRPVVVIQNDIGNKHSTTLIVAAVTTKIRKKEQMPTHYLIQNNPAFSEPSVVMLEQIRTIDKTRLKEKMGHLDDAVMDRVNDAITVSFGLGLDRTAHGEFFG